MITVDPTTVLMGWEIGVFAVMCIFFGIICGIQIDDLMEKHYDKKYKN